MKARPQHMIATLTLALALSAVLIGSAQAGDRPDNRAGVRGVGSPSTDVSDVFTRAVARAPSTQVTPTDVFERAVLRHNASTALRPDDRAGLRGAGTALADNTSVATTASAGFHWADAGFGAAATLALILILAGLAIARANRQRNHATPLA